MKERKMLFERYVDQRYGYSHPEQGSLTVTWKRYLKKNILPYLTYDNQPNILEIGCGMGQLLSFLKERGFTHLKGIDISQQQIDYAKKTGLDVERIDAIEFLRKEHTKYDTIIMFDVLEHFQKKHLIDLLQLTYSSLNEGGRCIVLVPNLANPIMAGSSRYIDFTHEVGFTEESLLQVMKLVGFENVMILKQCHNPSTIKGHIAIFVFYIFEKLCSLAFRAYGRNTTYIFSKNLICIAIKSRRKDHENPSVYS